MTSAFHGKQPIMPRRGSSSISAQDLLKLLGPESKNGFLRQKRVSKIIKSIKWSHKFVILAHNALYIYTDEMSKIPDISIPLLGYTAVERESTTTCAWVFALVPGVASLSRKSFACSSGAERKEWMSQIKQHLYKANNVKESSQNSKFKDKLKLSETLSDEEKMYLELELPIIHPDDMEANDPSVGDDDDDDDFSDDEDEDSLGTSSRGFGSKPNIKRRPTMERANEKGKDSPNSKGEISVDELDGMPKGIMPPRYSAIVGGVEREYQNLATAANKAKEFGLEMACTITDESINRDRDACIQMLKTTKKIGTYLIRKSRTENYKVLSVLVEEDQVKEFQIAEEFGLHHLQGDKTHEFPTLSSLLAYYSHHRPVPNFGGFLGWGIHECGDGSEETYEEPVKW